MNLADIKAECTKLHNNAMKEGRKYYPYTISRGKQLKASALTKDWDQLQGDAWDWDGSMKMLKKLFDEDKEIYVVWIECGYDGAGSSYEYHHDFYYDPWIETWDMLVFRDDIMKDVTPEVQNKIDIERPKYVS